MSQEMQIHAFDLDNIGSNTTMIYKDGDFGYNVNQIASYKNSIYIGGKFNVTLGNISFNCLIRFDYSSNNFKNGSYFAIEGTTTPPGAIIFSFFFFF